MCANCNPNAKNSFRNSGGVFQICENCKQISQKNMETPTSNMKKPELIKEEYEVYSKIITRGTMEDMFIFAYAIGRERIAKEQMELLKVKY